MKIKRRSFLAAGLAGMTFNPPRATGNEAAGKFLMPGEDAPHQKTWMAFGASAEIWGRENLEPVRKDLARIANAISEREEVAMLVRPREMKIAQKLLNGEIHLEPAEMNDLWMRDTAPVFALEGRRVKVAFDFNFNGWGNKQEHRLDSEIAGKVAALAGTEAIDANWVLEGGSLEVDGEGTAILTESSSLNPNRNPGRSKDEMERMLSRNLGAEKCIWLPGVVGADITDGHVDFYARFAKPGTVFCALETAADTPEGRLTREHRAILENETDARGRKLKVVPVQHPPLFFQEKFPLESAIGYLGFYLCKGAVVLQRFGHPKSDDAAREQFAAEFPDREMVSIPIPAISAGGGTIHCTVMQEPLLNQ